MICTKIEKTNESEKRNDEILKHEKESGFKPLS